MMKDESDESSAGIGFMGRGGGTMGGNTRDSLINGLSHMRGAGGDKQQTATLVAMQVMRTLSAMRATSTLLASRATGSR